MSSFLIPNPGRCFFFLWPNWEYSHYVWEALGKVFFREALFFVFVFFGYYFFSFCKLTTSVKNILPLPVASLFSTDVFDLPDWDVRAQVEKSQCRLAWIETQNTGAPIDLGTDRGAPWETVERTALVSQLIRFTFIIRVFPPAYSYAEQTQILNVWKWGCWEGPGLSMGRVEFSKAHNHHSASAYHFVRIRKFRIARQLI